MQQTLTILLLSLTLMLSVCRASHAYNLMINVRQDRVDIIRPVAEEDYAYAERDVDVQIRAQGLQGAPWRLEIMAQEDLLGPFSIPASTISWNAYNPPFVDGQIVKGTPQILAQGAGDVDTMGRVRFKFKTANYSQGNYNCTLKFIFSSP